MADANSKAWRERLVSLVSLAFGGVKDVAEFIDTGRVTEAARSAPAIDGKVARHMRACEIAGRFVMPEEVEAILGKAATTQTDETHND